ncbi:MAG: hypothetical protein Q9225_002570 [Loekoesia sp. 1 TL-2023]
MALKASEMACWFAYISEPSAADRKNFSLLQLVTIHSPLSSTDTAKSISLTTLSFGRRGPRSAVAATGPELDSLWRWFKGLAFISNLVLSQGVPVVSTMVKLPIQPICHHLHTNKPLHLPLDTQRHTRINCDRCEHPIVGIGRTSTQTTLASVETDAPECELQQRGDVETERDSQAVNCPTQLPPLRVDTSVNPGHLSTIAEGISPARQSSTALVSPRSGDPASERSVSYNWVGSTQSGGEQGHNAAEHGATQPGGPILENGWSRPFSRFWAGASERSFRNKIRRHFRKPRNFTIHRLGIHVEVSPTPLSEALPPPSAPSAEQRGGRHEDTDHPPTRMLGTALNTTTTADSLVGSRTNLAIAQTAEETPQPESGRPDRLIDRTPAQQDKHERIRTRRRDETLKRKAEMMAKCECRSECQCRNGSFRSNAASYGPEGSDRSIQIPDHHLHNLLTESTDSSTSRSSNSMVRALDLDGIGSHVHSDHGDGNADDPTNLATENQQFFDDRLSQASTAYVRSNGSSSSLISRRPSSLRRSNTAPGFPTRRLDGLRPHVIAALQNRNIPDQVHASASQAPDSSRGSDSDVGEPSTTAMEASTEVPDESTTRELDSMPQQGSDV